jgi:formylglycine-generating enzyme required for sulfatase activity
MAHDAFISHSSKDRIVADATCAWLESRGIRCWVAHRDILPGASWGSSIIQAIRSSRVMILIFSNHANASPQITREVERAVNFGVRIIPMRIENVLPEGDMEYFLGVPHWLDAFPSTQEHHLDGLVSAAQAILAAPARAAKTGVTEPEITETPMQEPEALPEPGLKSELEPEPVPAPEPLPELAPEVLAPPPPKKAPAPLAAGIPFLRATVSALGEYFGIEKLTEEEKIRRAQIAQEAMEKEKELEARRVAEAEQKAQLEAESRAAAEETARLEAEAARKAAEEAAAEQTARDEAAAQKAEEEAAAAAALAASHPKAGREWTNSLGLKFVPAGTEGVLFCTWPVRVQDWRDFVQATGYQQPGGIFVMKVISNPKGIMTLNWALDPKASWDNPGFKQGPDHPVVGVSWKDAEAFCQWLTKKEQGEGTLGSRQSYRLPTDAEWSAAAGEGKYPWGEDWPPPEGAGNYGDEAFVSSLPGQGWQSVPGNNGYSHTSPVGCFRPNVYGLYDMGGNVWEWCEDPSAMNGDEAGKARLSPAADGGDTAHRVLRGAAWNVRHPVDLRSECRVYATSGNRKDSCGFRCVVAVDP